MDWTGREEGTGQRLSGRGLLRRRLLEPLWFVDVDVDVGWSGRMQVMS